MPLNDIVNVVITRQTQTITEQGFGIPLIFGPSVRFEQLIKFYVDMFEVGLDFAPTDPEYVAAQDIFSQTISPNLIAIGRRQVDDVTVDVITAMNAEDYILTVNGSPLATTSSTAATYSVVNLPSDLVIGNRVNVSLNGDLVGTVTSVIDFDSDFVTGNSAVVRINNANMSGFAYTGDQASMMTGLAAHIATNAAVTGGGSATVTGPRQITVVFRDAGNNTIDSVITNFGVSQPNASITEGAFAYTGSSSSTMQAIADAIELEPGVSTAQVSGVNNRVLTVLGPVNVTAQINSFTVEGGVSQPVAVITNPLQPISPESIALDIVNNINDQVTADPTYPIAAVDNGDGTFTLTNRAPGTPWSLKISNTIGSPNRAIVRVTQVMPSTPYTATINGVDFSYTSPVTVQNAGEIVDDLVDLINNPFSNVPVTATNLSDGSFELTADNIGGTFSINVSPEIMSYDKGLLIETLVPVNTVVEDLDLINNANSSWYALISTSRELSTVLEIAGWVESRIKLFGTASNNQDIINVPAGTDSTSIAARLNQLGYVRTFVMYHQDALYDYPEAAWFGSVLPLEPGSETWKFKTLNGISYSNLTTTQSLNSLNKKANTYEFVGGIGITANGTVAQGEYIDIIRGIDWLTARIQEYVFRVLVTNPKVPYTDAGIASIQAEVMRVLQQGISNDFISDDPAPTSTVPRASEVSPSDKAARILRNVRFQATLAGAIHAVQIRGTVSV